jgi:hypothetical protein
MEDFAHQMRWLADAAYPEAEKVRVVLDNPVSSTGQALRGNDELQRDILRGLS